ncbi:periplasmic heavy metal sensor [Sphingomonas sp.]|uniref:periplasmic heavy metal sensor n=1 Tax=Sphingomonas sp. TaxID=28214 RepID=UPI000DB4D535|nr:periplasmic heavy metal sensor [Sphingomonas sp.]PZU07210.1 MAG: hypothetical protein DI605_16255 [Sphingomonas sp.]
MSRGIRILLIGSLILNVFLVGAIGGGVWRWTHGYGNRIGWRTQVADVLPPEQRRQFRAAMRQTALGARGLVIEGRQARAEAARLYVRPDFDAAAISTQLDRARAADVALRERLERRVVEFSAGLPVGEREKLAGALRQGPFRQPAAPARPR